MNRAFTLMELLVVMAIITLILGVLLPVVGSARLRAKVLTVDAELRDIGLALEAYSFDHENRYPPGRVDCMLGGHFYPLPCELTDEGYLPKPPPGTFLSVGIEDRFNPGYTYKYRSVGTLIYNRTTVVPDGACLWVPDGFPDHQQADGRAYSNLRDSPISWVLYSQGPNYDDRRMREMRYPIPKATWFNRRKIAGVVVRMRLKNGNQIGSFEGPKG